MPNVKQLNNEVLVAADNCVSVNRVFICELQERAGRSPRQRARLCAHPDDQARLHEMLIVLTRAAYIRPHKHIGKTESFHVIAGSANVVFFDDDGQIEEVLCLGDYASGKSFYFRSDGARYHTQLITSDTFIFHETTNGPFDRADTQLAPWSPDESAREDVAAFCQQLAARVGAFLSQRSPGHSEGA